MAHCSLTAKGISQQALLPLLLQPLLGLHSLKQVFLYSTAQLSRPGGPLSYWKTFGDRRSPESVCQNRDSVTGREVGEPMSSVAQKAMDPGAYSYLAGIKLFWNLYSVQEH